MSKITVYTKDFCPYCVQAKKQLADMGFEYEEINIETTPEAKEFVISEGHRTMPQIYFNGKPLVQGGADELAKLSENEINARMLNFNFDVSFKL